MVRLLGAHTHQGQRFARVTFTDGIASTSLESTFDVYGSIQPLSPRELANLTELERTSARAYLFTEVRLIVATEADERKGDRVRDCNGPLWEVQAVGDWTHHRRGLPHYKYELKEVGPDEE